MHHAPTRAMRRAPQALRTLDELPLAILSIQAAGASFSFTEEFAPAPTAAGSPPPPGSPPLRFVVQFESSGKWPDDLGCAADLDHVMTPRDHPT
eukprot:5681664-Prymnesium_polylepis.1